MYSYDVSAPPGRSATAPRSIPGMRPSYDAEHPHSTTPIYDELYSEYRRLFRALPGDRSGEEDLKFTGFAVRDTHPPRGEQLAYPPQQQAFHTYAGQPPGLPQFMPPQHQHQSQPQPPQPHPPHHPHTGSRRSHRSPAPQPNDAPAPEPAHTAPPSPQFTNGHGWIAAGYLGQAPDTAHPMPAPPQPPVPSPAPVTAAAPSTRGRHRQMLSLPPGRNGDHH